MQSEKRIDITTVSVQDSLFIMSDGNPGALNALVEIIKDTNQIDPDSALGAAGPVLQLDDLGIYGTDIYILFSDICGRNLARMLAVLRAVQLGLFSGDVVGDAAHRQDRSGCAMIPVEDLYKQVYEQLPRFDRASGGGRYAQVD